MKFYGLKKHLVINCSINPNPEAWSATKPENWNESFKVKPAAKTKKKVSSSKPVDVVEPTKTVKIPVNLTD